MARAEGTFSGRSQFRLIMDTSEASVNTANNTSAISWVVYIYMDVASSSYDLGTSSSWSASINGVGVGSGNYSYDFRGQSAGYSLTLGSGTYTYTHLSNGTGNPAIAASSTAASPLGSASGSSSQPVTDISRPPQAPSTSPSVSRTTNGSTMTITSAVAPDATGSPAPPSITNYKYRYSLNNSSWTEVTGMGLDRVDTFGPTSPITVSTTQPYYFQTAATNSEGYGAWSASATSFGVPGIPSSISTTKVARDVTVTVGTPTTNGGSPITGYFVQYSTNGGSSWSTAQAMTAQSYTYSGLTAGLTYRFRAYATNVTGDSDYATAADLFLAAGGKRYDGTTWNATTTAKRFDGTTWVDLTIAKRYNGTSWVDLS